MKTLQAGGGGGLGKQSLSFDPNSHTFYINTLVRAELLLYSLRNKTEIKNDKEVSEKQRSFS